MHVCVYKHKQTPPYTQLSEMTHEHEQDPLYNIHKFSTQPIT